MAKFTNDKETNIESESQNVRFVLHLHFAQSNLDINRHLPKIELASMSSVFIVIYLESMVHSTTMDWHCLNVLCVYGSFVSDSKPQYMWAVEIEKLYHPLFLIWSHAKKLGSKFILLSFLLGEHFFFEI